MNPNLKVPSLRGAFNLLSAVLLLTVGTGLMIQTAGKMTRTFTKRAGETIGDGILLGTKVK